jgi:hypothetical protein
MTSDHRHYRISPHAQVKARTFGMYGAIEDRINNMVRLSSPFVHPVGNRRFHQFLLKIEGDVVLDLIKFTPEEMALYDSPSHRQQIAKSTDEAKESHSEPDDVAGGIDRGDHAPQRESYARQWALQNKPDETKK